MKLLILLFLFIVVTCQAHQSPIRRRLISRQGEPEYDEPTLNDQIYEKLKKLAKKYMIVLDPELQSLLVPEIYKADHLRTSDPHKRAPGPLANNHVYNPSMSQQYSNPTPSHFNNPIVQKRNSYMPSHFTHPTINTRSDETNHLGQVAQTDQAEAGRHARLAQIDREALSKLSKEDKKIIESRLTLVERKALLAQLEDGELDDLLPREENRFGGLNGMGAFSGAAAQIGSSAGRYIGGKLAGTLGAKLGAAAGAYLGAAAASRFVKKSRVVSDFISGDVHTNDMKSKRQEVQHGSTYGFGAINV